MIDRSPARDRRPAMDDQHRVLRRAAELASAYLGSLEARPVGGPVDLPTLRAAMGVGTPLPDAPTDPMTVVEDLAAAAEPGLVGSAGPRYFGFVVGGGVPAAVGADWLRAWDQNAGLYALSPAEAVAEEVAAPGWRSCSDCRRHELRVRHRGADGQFHRPGGGATRHLRARRLGRRAPRTAGAPPVTVVTRRRQPRHDQRVAPDAGPRPGRRAGVRRSPLDDQGRMRPDALREALAASTARRSSVPRPAT